jgi:hypothetical protein
MYMYSVMEQRLCWSSIRAREKFVDIEKVNIKKIYVTQATAYNSNTTTPIIVQWQQQQQHPVQQQQQQHRQRKSNFEVTPNAKLFKGIVRM